MNHPFDLKIAELESLNVEITALSDDEAHEISGGLRKFPEAICKKHGSVLTTQAVGEEGGSDRFTTLALGEEGGGGTVTTLALGEEGGGGTVTTQAVGEEGGGTVTTLALGEEGGYA